MNHESAPSFANEFDRQVDTLLQKRYPEAAGISVKDFLSHINPLKDLVDQLAVPEKDLAKGRLPFVIVIRSDLVSTNTAMSLVEREGKPGLTKLYPHEPEDFHPIDLVTIPDTLAYFLVDIDRGKGSINLPPIEAMAEIIAAGRLPLTIDEGVAIVTHHPEFLMKNNCFSLLASRHPGDKRVPALWINGKRQPNLGWCWDGNPHTWLGSASCFRRVHYKF